MSTERLLLDTSFVQALLNRHDQFHAQAIAFLPRVRAAIEAWVTEAVPRREHGSYPVSRVRFRVSRVVEAKMLTPRS